MAEHHRACGKCGQDIPLGKAIVIHYGRGGLLCPKCQPAKATLANGEPFERKGK